MNKLTRVSNIKWFLIIVVIASLVRLYRVTNPVSDWHAFRQADTASVTREYVKHGIDLLHPRYHDMSNIQSGKDNPQGYRMVEFPFTNALLALIIRIVPGPQSVELVSRLASIVVSLGTLGALYGLVRRLSGNRAAWLSAVVFALLPYSIYYSRAILPEPHFMWWSTLSLWAFSTWLDTKNWKWYGLAFLSLTLAFLLKPFVIFLVPVYLALIWHHQGWKGFKNPLVYGFVLTAVPLLAWREWIKQYPTGIPVFEWLFNGNGIRFRPAWFRWLFWERLTVLILGYSGVLFAVANFLKWSKDMVVYAAWWVGIVAYFIVIATGNVQHDYYQVLALPLICVTVGRGIESLALFLSTKLPQVTSLFVVLLIAGTAWWLAWEQVGGYFNVNHWEYVKAGQAVNELTPPDALVIAPAFGDTQFLYQTNRRGWPIGFEIDDKIAKGATHYVTTSYDDEARALEARFKTIAKTSDYLLLDLTQPMSVTP